MPFMSIDNVLGRQFCALWIKNWIVLSKHKVLNLARCLILPFAYGIFLAVAQIFLNKPNQYGLGTPTPIPAFKDVFDPSLSLIWADGTNLSSSVHPSPSDIMSFIISELSPAQQAAVQKVATPDDIPFACPQNFNLFSECFAAIAFTSFPSPTNVSLNSIPQLSPPLNVSSILGGEVGSSNVSQSLDGIFAAPNGTDIIPPQTLLNYTIRADAGLGFIDVIHHKSDYEIRILPLQWAIDQAIIQLHAGSKPPNPLDWPYSIETDKQQTLQTRLDYIRGLRTLLVLALFINFIGISYHIPGSYVTERTIGLTAHLRAMGLRDLPRILSWHAAISAAYLPGWILTGILWHFRIFTGTNLGLMIVIHLLTGLSLASYSFFISLPSISPSLSAATSTFLAIILAIFGLVFAKASTTAATIFTLIFPPAFYVFTIRAIAGFELHQIPTSVIKGDPDNGLVLLPIILAALIDVFLYPYLTVLLERRFYDVRNPPTKALSNSILSTGAPTNSANEITENKTDHAPAIIVEHLTKQFPSSTLPRILRPWTWLGYLYKKICGKPTDKDEQGVTAISDLSFTVPRGGIFVLLGSNGAGKSTSLGIIAGLIDRSSGLVVFPEDDSLVRSIEKTNGPEQPSDRDRRKLSRARGSLGIVPQKNVLFPELTCYETLRLWSAIKRPSNAERRGQGSGVYVEKTKEDLEKLLIDCGLETKIHANAGNLSGGQKRKLQLAIGLVGGSEIVLVDECTSGVDPLSRRSIWRTLTSVKHERTIVFTTHFLDEADLLADNIAILAAPGKLVAEGSPVSLKSRLGKGYTLRVRFEDTNLTARSRELLEKIRPVAPNVTSSTYSAYGSDILLHSKDSQVVKEVLKLVQSNMMTLGVAHYEIHSTSIEDIFLELMASESNTRIEDEQTKSVTASEEDASYQLESGWNLTSGRKKHPLSQSLTIFYKRCLVFRKSWLPPLLAVAVAVAGSCIPLFFLSNRQETCQTTFSVVKATPLYLGDSPFSSVGDLLFPGNEALVSPPSLAESLGPSLAGVPIEQISDNNTFVQTILSSFMNLSLGGVSIDLDTGEALVAWQASPPGLTAPTLLNLASNILYNRALNVSGRSANLPSIIAANYQSLPFKNPGSLRALDWVAFYGAAMAVFPAFFALYVSMERRSSVQAMQFSNGLTNPVGLWLGHLLFDSIFCLILSTIITIVFAAVSNQFNGLGYMWLIMVLYGIAAALFAYCVTLFTPSPLAAFAAVAAYQVIIFILYISAYLLTLTYVKSSKAPGIISIIHYTGSLVSPVASVLRACFVSIDLFSLLCANSDVVTSTLGDISKFGGPIVYLIGQSVFYFLILVYSDSGSLLPLWLQFTRPKPRESVDNSASMSGTEDIIKETEEVESLFDDPLRVVHVTKVFNKLNKAVDDVSFRVPQNTVFAMLGPNGAGKTSTFNIIRGDISPDFGDVYINQTSIISHPNTARLRLGVCPQFTAIDPQLTVREHLVIYGLLKGLRRGSELEENISILLRGTTLAPYGNRLASQLSGGNQRKLSFAISLIGNPSVILIDEYSTGIDPATKRSMWATFRKMAVGKAVVITTHSMEEASALANKVGILAGKMLAIGSMDDLTERYALYEVHFSARTREEIMKAQALMTHIPGSRLADDVATRFEVPISDTNMSTDSGQPLTLAQLFEELSNQSDFIEYTVERVSLESIFLKVIRQHDIQEENSRTRTRRRRRFF